MTAPRSTTWYGCQGRCCSPGPCGTRHGRQSPKTDGRSYRRNPNPLPSAYDFRSRARSVSLQPSLTYSLTPSAIQPPRSLPLKSWTSYVFQRPRNGARIMVDKRSPYDSVRHSRAVDCAVNLGHPSRVFGRCYFCVTYTRASAESSAIGTGIWCAEEWMSIQGPSPSFLLIFRQILNPFGVKALCKAKCYPNS